MAENKMVSMRVSPELWKWVGEVSQEYGLPKSRVVKMLVIRDMNRGDIFTMKEWNDK